jgi:NAD(P)H-hydrate repair Nnr-like enzyme with NAD(P)H-hydrate dehydratase domain
MSTRGQAGAGAVLAGALAALLANSPVSAAEEMTVYGTATAQMFQAKRERFHADMRTFAQSVGAAMREAREANLKQLATPPRVQFASSRTPARG